eukprot:6805921-Lingulodinium_polyedra.AAC.1
MPGKGPKMRSKAAESRGLIAFGVECATDLHLHSGTLHSLTVKQCMVSLMDFYALLSLSDWNAEAGVRSCSQFCTLYAALHSEAEANGEDQRWKITPKLHMFVELAEQMAPHLGNPAEYWNYCDEDFVGWVASLARSRGGRKAASTAPTTVLNRYRALKSL